MHVRASGAHELGCIIQAVQDTAWVYSMLHVYQELSGAMIMCRGYWKLVNANQSDIRKSISWGIGTSLARLCMCERA